MMECVRYLILQEEKLNQDQEARDDDHLEDLEANDKQEEIHLPDRKVRIIIDIYKPVHDIKKRNHECTDSKYGKKASEPFKTPL